MDADQGMMSADSVLLPHTVGFFIVTILVLRSRAHLGFQLSGAPDFYLIVRLRGLEVVNLIMAFTSGASEPSSNVPTLILRP